MSSLFKQMGLLASFPEYHDGEFLCLEDAALMELYMFTTLLKDLPAMLSYFALHNYLPWILPTSSLQKPKFTLPKSRICAWLKAFFTPLLFLNFSISWSLQLRLP